jgi:hypothetical protein
VRTPERGAQSRGHVCVSLKSLAAVSSSLLLQSFLAGDGPYGASGPLLHGAVLQIYGEITVPSTILAMRPTTTLSSPYDRYVSIFQVLIPERPKR